MPGFRNRFKNEQHCVRILFLHVIGNPAVNDQLKRMNLLLFRIYTIQKCILVLLLLIAYTTDTLQKQIHTQAAHIIIVKYTIKTCRIFMVYKKKKPFPLLHRHFKGKVQMNIFFMGEGRGGYGTHQSNRNEFHKTVVDVPQRG